MTIDALLARLKARAEARTLGDKAFAEAFAESQQRVIDQRRANDRHSPEASRWRASVIARDGRCADCGGTANLAAHHIEPWSTRPDLRLDLSNGVTVCVPCHAKRHPEMPQAFFGASQP